MKVLILTGLMTLPLPVHAATEEINYKLAVEVKGQRMGKFVIRYLRVLHSECLGYVQSLYNNDQSQWVIYKTKSLCTIDDESVAKDFTDASITELTFGKGVVRMIISTTPLYPKTTSQNPMGEYFRSCTIKVDNGTFSPMSCDKPQRVGE